MNEIGAIFIVTLTAIILLAALLHSWMRTRGEIKIAAGSLEATRKLELLSNENAGLKGQVSRLEERIAVLERLATDPAERTAREIDQLR